MAKRHGHVGNFASRVQRMQEIIMSRSGIDEFYEVLRLIIAKFLAERDGLTGLPDRERCDALLAAHRSDLAFALDGNLTLQTPSELMGEIKLSFAGVHVGQQGFVALDHAFELLTARQYKANKGQYFTPRHVIDMCVAAIAPTHNELICDPACGSAAFLNSVHRYGVESGQGVASLYGFDYSHRACQVAQIVSFIATGSALRIEQIDSLAKGDSSRMDGNTIEQAMGGGFTGFDAILTNPPFAGDVSADAFSKDYELAASARIERDVLFIERCVDLLKPGGRLAIILPDNKVSSRAFRDVRAWLGRKTAIKAVVSLHRYTFLPYTSQKAVVLFGIKNLPGQTYHGAVTFLRSERPGKTSNGSPLYRPDADPNTPPFTALDHDLHEAVAPIREALCAA